MCDIRQITPLCPQFICKMGVENNDPIGYFKNKIKNLHAKLSENCLAFG